MAARFNCFRTFATFALAALLSPTFLAAAHAATLNVNLAATGVQFVSATAEGTLDWAYWGPSQSVPAGTVLLPANSKTAGTGIGTLSLVGPGQIDITTNHASHTWSFTDGAAPASGSAQPGIGHSGSASANATAGNGMRMIVDADDQLRTLRFYGAARRTEGTLIATLSDGSATALPIAFSSPANETGFPVFEITYAASAPGHSLTLDWITTAVSAGSSGGSSGNLRVSGLTLSGPAFLDPLVAFRFDNLQSQPAASVAPSFVHSQIAVNSDLNIRPADGGPLQLSVANDTGQFSQQHSTTPVLVASPGGSTSLEAARLNNGYFEFTLAAEGGQVLNLQTISFDVARGDTTQSAGWALYSSVDDFDDPLMSVASESARRPNLNNYVVDLSDSVYSSLSDITFRFYAFSSDGIVALDFDNLRVFGTLSAAPVIPEPGTLLLALLGLAALPHRRFAGGQR